MSRVPARLTADLSGISDLNGVTGIASSARYHWQRFDAAGTTLETDAIGSGPTYNLTRADVGKKIKVEVRFIDDRGQAEGPLVSPAWPASGRITGEEACASPRLGADEVRVWTGRLWVGRFPGKHWGFGASDGVGALDGPAFSIGSTTYTVDRVRAEFSERFADVTQVPGSQAVFEYRLTDPLEFSLDRSLGREKDALTLYVCDRPLKLKDASGPSSGHTYRWSSSGLDLRNHAARTLVLADDTSVQRNSGAQVVFRDAPERHDGATAFTVGLHFNGDPAGLEPKRDAASVLEVAGGSVTDARQTATGANPAWEVTVAPDGVGAVTVRVPARACTDAHAVCIGGEPLAEAAETTVPGPAVAVGIAGPEATPAAEGAALAFTLTRTGDTAAALTVAVDVTETGSVLDGAAPTSVTFAEGAATAALSVATVDDEAAEGASTVTAALAAGAGYAVDADAGSAEAAVEDDDAAPAVTTASPIEVEEGATAVAALAATDADTDAEGLSWSIPAGAAGGADRAHFALTAAGALSFLAAKDFEAPDDANQDGDYEVTVRVTDGANPVDAALTVRLTDDGAAARSARFQDLPERHDGTAFTLGIRFSGAPAGLNATRDAASALEVAGGSVTGRGRRRRARTRSGR